MKAIPLSRQQLYDYYVTQGYSQRDIAQTLGVGQTTIRRAMKKYGIEARHSIDSRHTPHSIAKQQVLSERYSKEYTIERYNICEHCGKEFAVNSKTKHNKYCSPECVRAARKKPDTQYCIHCGALITFPSERTYPRKYCDDCSKQRVWIKRTQYTYVSCRYCGKPIQINAKQAQKTGSHYCSTECMARDYAGRFSGENSPTWKGGKSAHYGGNFFHARKDTRRRDGYTCQLCGISEEQYGQELSVHHIRPYRCFEDKQAANNLDNLISLCEPCHRFIHSKRNTSHLFIKS